MVDDHKSSKRTLRATKITHKRRSFLERMFTENLPTKVLALVIALLLYWLVRQDKGHEVDIEVPVVLSNILEHEVFVGEMPKVLRVRIRDRWSQVVKALERKPKPYLVDLRGFSDQTVYVFDTERVQQLIGVPSASIQSIYPSDFVVRKETKVERVIPVRPNLVGEPPEGYEILRQKVTVDPQEIRIWGAKSSVRQVNELITYPVNLSGIEKDVRLEVKIQKPALSFVFLDAEEVTVHIPVQVLEGKKVFDQLAVSVRDCPTGHVCRVEPSYVRANLAGPRPVLLRVERGQAPIEIVALIDEEEATPGKHAGVALECRRPAELECRLSPHKVTLWVSKEEENDSQDAKTTDTR